MILDLIDFTNTTSLVFEKCSTKVHVLFRLIEFSSMFIVATHSGEVIASSSEESLGSVLRMDDMRATLTKLWFSTTGLDVVELKDLQKSG